MTVRLPDLPVPLPPFRRRDCGEVGLTRHQVDALVHTGRLVEPFTGVCVDPRAADDVQHRARAAALVLPPGAALARRTAAWLHGVDARGPGAHQGPVPLDCVVPGGVVLPRRPGLLPRAAVLPEADVVLVAGVPVTSPERTALDLARWSPPHMGLAVLDAMAGSGLIDLASLCARIEEQPGDRFIARARRLVGLCEPATESFGESWCRLRVVDAGFPRPKPQIWVPACAGRPAYRLDLGWEEQRKALEFDGEEFHSSPAQRAADAERRGHLEREADWRILVARRGDVLGRDLALERAVGELLGMAPTIRQRLW